MSDEEQVEEELEDVSPMYEKGSSARWIEHPYESMYVVHACHIVLASLGVATTMFAMKFVLLPLLMAYFVTFLMAPMMDMMEMRPYQMGDGYMCKQEYVHPARKRYMNTARGDWLEITLLGRMPHMIAVLVCLLLSFFVIYVLFSVISGSFAEFNKVEEQKVENGDKPMKQKMYDYGNEIISNLEESGLNLERPWICMAPDDMSLALNIVETDTKGVEAFRLNVYKNFVDLEEPSEFDKTARNGLGATVINGEANFTCMQDPIFRESDGNSLGELLGYIALFQGLLTEAILIALLSVYILLEREAGSTVSGDHISFEQIEAMVKNYISLKTALSALTGFLVFLFLSIAGVPLSAVFGLLAFLFNFIPNVGSLIAMVLPLPIIILDETITPVWKIIAFCGPAAVQMYVGNFLEPAVFGASLNLTALSVLIALVFYAFLWGLRGAVLSVPLLGAMKIILHHTEHPLAKYMLVLIRENKTVDYDGDREFLRQKAEFNKATDIEGVELIGTIYELKEEDSKE